MSIAEADKRVYTTDALELVGRAQAGDQEAEEQLIRENAALIHSVARRFRDRGCDYEDLYQIGSIGFIKAVRNFNSDFKVCFSTYAVPMIMGEIRRFLRDDGIIKVSRSIKEKARGLMSAQSRLQEELQREPSVMELAEASGIEPEEISMVMEAMAPISSIDEEITDGHNPLRSIDTIADETQLPERGINRIIVKEMLGNLEPRERQIIMMRYFGEKTQSEIAREIGVSQVQISRLESKILRKLRGMV